MKTRGGREVQNSSRKSDFYRAGQGRGQAARKARKNKGRGEVGEAERRRGRVCGGRKQLEGESVKQREHRSLPCTHGRAIIYWRVGTSEGSGTCRSSGLAQSGGAKYAYVCADAPSRTSARQHPNTGKVQ